MEGQKTDSLLCAGHDGIFLIGSQVLSLSRVDCSVMPACEDGCLQLWQRVEGGLPPGPLLISSFMFL